MNSNTKQNLIQTFLLAVFVVVGLGVGAQNAKAFSVADCVTTTDDTCTVNATKTLIDGEEITSANLGGLSNLVITGALGILQTNYNATTFHYDSFVINMTGDVSILLGASITGNVEITANNLTIDGTSSIDVSGKGYVGGVGGGYL